MVEDEGLYSKTKEYVKECFSNDYNQLGNTLILSISRKGPKFLEYLFGREQPSHYNVITEVALPFCMRKLSRQREAIKVKVFDDAIYYGTTAEGIISELEAFERMYNIQAENSLYTAIRAKESRTNFGKSFDKVDIHSYNDDFGIPLRKGYGHFFIRRLEKDFSDMGNTLEVEFPMIEFECEQLDDERLFGALKIVYENEKTYVVKKHNQKSFSVVFKENNGQAFRKIRVYTHQHIVRIVGIAPWLLPNDMSIISSLFSQSMLRTVWESLQEAYSAPMDERGKYHVYQFMQVERCIRKSLIILANYLLSYQLLLAEKVRIEQALQKAHTLYKYEGIRQTDLFYLIGDESICEDIKRVFDSLWSFTSAHIIPLINPNFKSLDKKVEYQVFENKDFPDSTELTIFEQRNSEMLKNCSDEKEALSILFFNQTLLIEKWSRVDEKYDFGRLRFGYTFDSLEKDIAKKFASKTKVPLKQTIHQWIDNRIDQACVVPQYIIDGKTNTWVRVFRPGENEDALISHLARFVISVFKSIDSVQRLGWLYENTFRELLCLAVMGEFGNKLKDVFEFALIPDIDKRKLFYQYEDETRRGDVIDFMVAMKILDRHDSAITISRDLYDDEMMEATTLDIDIQKKLSAHLTGIMNRIVEGKYEKYVFFVTNFYYFQKSDINALHNLNQTSLDILKQIVSHIETGDHQDTYGKLVAQDYYSTQRYVVTLSLLEDDKEMAKLPLNETEMTQYKREMLTLWMIKSVYELIIVTYLHVNSDYLAKEVSDNIESTILYGHHLELDPNERRIIRGMIKSGKNMVEIRKTMLPIIKKIIDAIAQIRI
jgi:hypothetical protein